MDYKLIGTVSRHYHVTIRKRYKGSILRRVQTSKVKRTWSHNGMFRRWPKLVPFKARNTIFLGRGKA